MQVCYHDVRLPLCALCLALWCPCLHAGPFNGACGCFVCPCRPFMSHDCTMLLAMQVRTLCIAPTTSAGHARPSLPRALWS